MWDYEDPLRSFVCSRELHGRILCALSSPNVSLWVFASVLMKYPFSCYVMLQCLIFDSKSIETTALSQNNGNQVAGDTASSYC